MPLYNLMEDAATAEISRAQLWQWINNNIKLSENLIFTKELFDQIVLEECEKIKNEIIEDNYNRGKFDLAINLFSNMIKKGEFDEFLTQPAYEYI